MKAFEKELNAIKAKNQENEAIANQENEVSLRKANSEIEDMFKGVDK